MVRVVVKTFLDKRGRGDGLHEGGGCGAEAMG